MQRPANTSAIVLLAGRVWLAVLLGMALIDLVFYATPVRLLLTQRGLPASPGAAPPLLPIYLFYGANGLAALVFLALASLQRAQARAQQEPPRLYYPLMVALIAGAPILINTLLVPRFPPGPLGEAEGMALRQMPALFVALALIAWRYGLRHIILFALASAALEMGLLLGRVSGLPTLVVLLFVVTTRTLSLIAVGIFIHALVTRLREMNAGLTHYAATLEQLTVTRERNRMARELHDTLAHSLTALSVSLETAAAYFDLDRDKARELLDKSLASARAGADETRRALRALRASRLEDLGLRLAVEELARSTADRCRLSLDLAMQASLPSLSPDTEQAIYRIAQEAVENVARHARATRLSVRLFHDRHLNLIVEDDGRGFDVQAHNTDGHFGLAVMRERARLAGGALRIDSRPGQGTRVALQI